MSCPSAGAARESGIVGLTSVARKRPQLPRGSRDLSYTSREQNDDDDQSYNRGTSVVLRRVEQDLDHRLPGRGAEDAGEITDAEDVCDSHCE